MIKTLVKYGNGLALVIDDSILQSLRISADTPLELTTEGNSILISPVREKPHREDLQDSLDKINQRFGDDLRRLAE